MLNDMRPIGYWLKHLDSLIEATFERTLDAERLSRRHWQILNVISEGVANPAAVRQALAPFEVSDEIDELVSRGWLRRLHDGQLELTSAGREAHPRLLEQVRTTRQQMVQGVSESEYRGTVATLQRMAANLASVN